MQTSNQQLNVLVVPVTPFEQNCSIVQCLATKECAAIDPGGDLEKIEQAIEKLNGKLTQIWVTHAHIDHVGGVQDLHTAYNVPISGPHREDQFWIDMLSQQGQMFRFPNAKPFKPTHWLEHQSKVTLGQLTFEVLHVPGHTPGHIAFYHAPSKLAFVGDILFEGSIGRTDFPRGNHHQLVNGIKQILLPLGDDITFVPGHGDTSTFGHERQFNPYLK